MKILIVLSFVLFSLNSFSADCKQVADKAAADAAREQLNSDGNGTVTGDAADEVTSLTNRFYYLNVYAIIIGDEVGYTDWLVITDKKCKVLSVHMGSME